MAAWKRKGGIDKFEARLIGGMLANGYSEDFADRIFEQIKGFGDYGFPESHAYSFALLAYASSWLKCHEPACFLAAMLNSQPMGFYAPSQLIQDAQRHGVRGAAAGRVATATGTARSNRATWHAPAVRLGLRLVGSLREEARTPHSAGACRRRPFRRHRRPGPARAARRAGPDGAGRRPMRCNRWPAIAASRCGKRPRSGARRQLLRGRAHPRGAAGAAAGARRRGDRLRLRLDGPHAAPPSAGAAAAAAGAHGASSTPSSCTSCRNGRRVVGLRHRHRAPAAADGQRHHLRHARGRDRPGQRDRVDSTCARSSASRCCMRGCWRCTAPGSATWTAAASVCHLIAERLEDLTPLLGRLGRDNRSRDFH